MFFYVGKSTQYLYVHRTHGGIFTTPGDAYTTPVEMWVKGLGMFFNLPCSLNGIKFSCYDDRGNIGLIWI